MSENEKEDFVEIHKFCINCGKEAIERIATKKGHYGIIYEFVKAKFLCRDCNPFKTDYYGNIPSLLLIKTGKRTGGVFTLIKEGDGDDK